VSAHRQRGPSRDPAIDQFESAVWANVPHLMSPDGRARRCAIECVRAAADDYADLRRTETLPDDVRPAAEFALRRANAAPDAPSPDQAAFRRYVLDQAVDAWLSRRRQGLDEDNHDDEGERDVA
jgi:hypothetical protein